MWVSISQRVLHTEPLLGVHNQSYVSKSFLWPNKFCWATEGSPHSLALGLLLEQVSGCVSGKGQHVHSILTSQTLGPLSCPPVMLGGRAVPGKPACVPVHAVLGASEANKTKPQPWGGSQFGEPQGQGGVTCRNSAQDSFSSAFCDTGLASGPSRHQEGHLPGAWPCSCLRPGLATSGGSRILASSSLPLATSLEPRGPRGILSPRWGSHFLIGGLLDNGLPGSSTSPPEPVLEGSRCQSLIFLFCPFNLACLLLR